MHNVSAKLEDSSFDHIPSASRPVSPDSQLQSLVSMDTSAVQELTKEDAQVYTRYIQEELKEDNIEVMSKDLLDKIK